MLLIKDPFFCDPIRGYSGEVVELSIPVEQKSLKQDTFYVVGDLVYPYIGPVEFPEDISCHGTIFEYQSRYYIEPHPNSQQDMYCIDQIMSKQQYLNRITREGSIETMLDSYLASYRTGNNLIRSGNIKITPLGEIYNPSLEDTDDPLERIIKLMIRHKQIVLTGHDNLRSALNGATKNMSINKFLEWCDILRLDWSIKLTNDESVLVNINPLVTPVVLSSKTSYPWVDIKSTKPNVYTVPLTPNDDPLKWAIKLALHQKQIILKDYKKKGSTEYLVNNMSSALKTKSVMRITYFLAWCEILNMDYAITIINQEDSIYYTHSGNEIITNKPKQDN